MLRRVLLALTVLAALLSVGLAPAASAAPSSAKASAAAYARHVKAERARIISIAKKYVGKTRYVEGGASPKRGFDCSGYVQWVYAHAHAAKFPHNAEAQRHHKRWHRVSAHTARPGDLVFYMSGRSAFHVAVYAGHGMQYAAATPRDGIRYQHVWSSNVRYRTFAH
jgi:cell wall-associated NlpC family hydrolase